MSFEETLSAWDEFVKILSREVLPIYLAHENAFDRAEIHSRMHICRAVIFAEGLSRFYLANFDLSLDVAAVRVATAFHDSGRKGNGVDVWEQESANLCRNFLVEKGVDENWAEFSANIILKHSQNCIEKRIMHDADVLEIMRPCCGHGGRLGINIKKLRFANYGDPFFEHAKEAVRLREEIVDEAWQLIRATEEMKPTFKNLEDYFNQVMVYLQANAGRFPFWSGMV